jgi:magnesium-protoporphyrin IX monomethyl ester (oxidative) cyclase
MYLNDIQRSSFYANIGLDTKKFDIHVIRKTNQSSAKLFPVILDLDNSLFFNYLEECCKENLELLEIEEQKINSFEKIIQKTFKIFNMIILIIKMFLIKPINTENEWEVIF